MPPYKFKKKFVQEIYKTTRNLYKFLKFLYKKFIKLQEILIVPWACQS